MEAIELSVYGKDTLGKPMVERKEYYPKTEADAEIARLNELVALHSELRGRLDAEVERLKEERNAFEFALQAIERKAKVTGQKMIENFAWLALNRWIEDDL
jgi:hypothetical protein